MGDVIGDLTVEEAKDQQNLEEKDTSYCAVINMFGYINNLRSSTQGGTIHNAI